MRTVEHAGAVASRRRVHDLGLGGLFDDAVGLDEGTTRAIDADRIAYEESNDTVRTTLFLVQTNTDNVLRMTTEPFSTCHQRKLS